MKLKLMALLATGSLVGCEQASQRLPFEVEPAGTRTVGAQGGTVSTPAGASIHIPAGAFSSAVGVSVSSVSVPPQVQQAGVPASEAFRIEPAGAQLTRPAQVEVRLSTSVDPARAWLASLVTMRDGQVRESGSSRVDLSSGVVTAEVSQLGTLAVVIPSAGAVFPVRSRASTSVAPLDAPLGSLQAGAVTDSASVHCGDPENRCSGIEVTASQNILNQVDEAALVYPTISGVLRRSSQGATGAITASASLRLKLQSGQTAETVEVVALLQPTSSTVLTETATELRFTNVLHRISGSANGQNEPQEEIATLVVPKVGSGATISIRRSFQIRSTGGGTEAAEVSLTFPVQLHP